jgi:hypothetical protein
VLLHGLLMLIAWLAISAVATFIARYLKDLGHGWYLMHRGLMTIVVVATFIGFILITIHVGADGVHYGSPHAVIGVLVVMFSIVQPLIGILSNRWWSPNRNGTPVFPDVVHWWLGRIVIALGFINCLLGILLFNADQASGAMILFLIWVVVIIVYTALGQKFIGAIHHNSTPFDKEPQKVDVAAWRNISMVLLAAGIVASIVMILLLAFTGHSENKKTSSNETSFSIASQMSHKTVLTPCISIALTHSIITSSSRLLNCRPPLDDVLSRNRNRHWLVLSITTSNLSPLSFTTTPASSGAAPSAASTRATSQSIDTAPAARRAGRASPPPPPAATPWRDCRRRASQCRRAAPPWPA